MGLIADTHGLLRPEALRYLQGSSLILHAGDIGGPQILAALSALAPVVAVRGNNDTGLHAHGLPDIAMVRVGGVLLYVVHDQAQIDEQLISQGVLVVITGHSHKPMLELRGDVLFINPGSAGPRRFSLPITLGRLTVTGASRRAEIVNLLDGVSIAKFP